ncbi:MAG: hypothetical protein K2X87_03545 [Gemmataceae bacterium]|nr:hypothetical protein [Gemmataceae bacterium]
MRRLLAAVPAASLLLGCVLLAAPPADPKPPAGERVVAEGAGRTAEEATKDALRNAVRQVVGAVVDAETVVKNDEVITDQVLTYSDGLVNTYTELSRKEEKGLVRVRIDARVERRAVVKKLEAAKVTVKAVDGAGLFAGVVTEIDAEKDAAAVVEKALAGFPLNCLTASVEGKPEVVARKDDQATVRLKVKYEADPKAYDAFATRLRESLDKVARAKGEFSLRAKVGRDGDFAGFVPQPDRWIARDIPPGTFILAVNTQRTKAADRTEWRYYVLDLPVRRAVAAIGTCVLTNKISLLDSDEETVAVDRSPAAVAISLQHGCRANLVHAMTHPSRHYGIWPGPSGLRNQNPLPEPGLNQHLLDLTDHPKDGERLFAVAPVMFTDDIRADDKPMYVPSLIQTRDITLSLDELRRLHTATCELAFDGDLPPKPDDRKQK